MRLLDGHPVFTASDLADFLDCEHLTALQRKVMAGELERPYFPDPTRDLLAARGLQHEQRHLEHLRRTVPGELVEIEIPRPKELASWQAAGRETQAALARGAAIVYQGTFCDETWLGRPDFLVRCDQPSALGNWSYVVVDTKLATHTKARAIIQLCTYSEMLGRAQGRLPETFEGFGR